MTRKMTFSLMALAIALVLPGCDKSTKTGEEYSSSSAAESMLRERVKFNDDWRFFKYEAGDTVDKLIYDVRPSAEEHQDDKAADALPTEAVALQANQEALKPYVLPTANRFIASPKDRHIRPQGNPGGEFPFVKQVFDDSDWQAVTLPHDWAIEGPFYEGWDAPVGGGMGRLPSPGVGWYRKSFDVPISDAGKSVFLDIDGAMSYSIVWLNGKLVGGWPYGYASYRLNLTPYLKVGESNQLAVRLDNPPASSRWYPGGGLYRNVWLTKTNAVHVGQWGTQVTTPQVSKEKATIDFSVTIENDLKEPVAITAKTSLYALDEAGSKTGTVVASFAPLSATVAPSQSEVLSASLSLDKPRLWGPLPTQTPNRYLAVTTLEQDGKAIDQYETRFGIRALKFDGTKGVLVNGEPIYIQGANQHHDLGALGAAFNVRAAERQLEILREMGTNAIRMAHNPPARELLELTDRMGFLVVDEIFDVWERKKTPLDFHLIFPEWSEPDTRAFIRRDRNHPSVIMWSIGNEVGEQYTGDAGAVVAQRLQSIAKEEDPTRPTAASMNFAKPDMPLSGVMDTISLNYQGEGIRNAPAYAHLQGIRTSPLYPAFHQKFPEKLILSSENAAAVSSRGEYLFPVAEGISAPIADGAGGDPNSAHVSAYELYTAPFGSSADKVLGSLAQHPYVGGGFVWSGWDYLGEPTPYYSARSSYFGVIDLAGFKKDRFYLYQAHWRPELPMAHILPHWNWPDRVGKVTPVHVFTSGDEAELFLNGESLGRKKKAEYTYRLRWDNVIYQPGKLDVVAYKDGQPWAQKSVETTDKAQTLTVVPDRSEIRTDGEDLAFVTVRVVDEKGRTIPNAKHTLTFTLEGPGEIVATDNGDPTDLVSFTSHERKAFNGLALVIIKAHSSSAHAGSAEAKNKGRLKLTVMSPDLKGSSAEISLKP